jgi:hypothetical protein
LISYKSSKKLANLMSTSRPCKIEMKIFRHPMSHI